MKDISVSRPLKLFSMPVPVRNFGRKFVLIQAGVAVLCLLAGNTICAAEPAKSLADNTGDFEKTLQPFFKQRCQKCHGAGKKIEGDLNLLQLKSADDLVQNAQLVTDLIDALEDNAMPPDSEPEIPAAKRERILAQLKTLRTQGLLARKTLAHTPIRRMNRFQYSNAVQDLFELKPTVFALPERMLREHRNWFQPQTGKVPDTVFVGSRPLGKSQLIEPRLAGVAPFPQDLRAENGFDNQGDHLSLSPLLLESFMKLSRSIVDSPDFSPANCGLWNEFFAPPANNDDLALVIRNRLQPFLTRAFRRPADVELLNRYTNFVQAQMANGQTFTESMQDVAAATIASPRFLYLYDGASKHTQPEKIDDYELASRLSFFLWGSLPDQTLLDLAATGKLSETDILREQVQRMLRDRRLKRFCDSFAPQWLQLERIISSVPDMDANPEFYFAKYRVSMHMMLEPLLVFETILIENRSIIELIASDFSYRSPLLESWYKTGKRGKSAPPTQIPFHRVKVTDPREGGVITTAAIMTMTSNPTRTQPISRGAWVASVIFNDAPEPPPADVPPLAENTAANTEHLTIRERLAVHRKRTDCAGCHARIDPLGFALENYGPTGNWREKYPNGRDVDSSGILFGKQAFKNAVEFKSALLVEKDRFARGFAEHLLTFALGRKLDVVDSLTVDRIVAATIADDYRMQTLIEQIVLSEPFLQKYAPATEPVTNGQ